MLHATGGLRRVWPLTRPKAVYEVSRPGVGWEITVRWRSQCPCVQHTSPALLFAQFEQLWTRHATGGLRRVWPLTRQKAVDEVSRPGVGWEITVRCRTHSPLLQHTSPAGSCVCHSPNSNNCGCCTRQEGSGVCGPLTRVEPFGFWNFYFYF